MCRFTLVEHLTFLLMQWRGDRYSLLLDPVANCGWLNYTVLLVVCRLSSPPAIVGRGVDMLIIGRWSN